MSEKAQDLLHKIYAPAVEHRLSRFPSKDQLPIASWLVQTPVGTNFALQILELLEGLSQKEEKNASALLTHVLSSLENNELHPKEIGQQVRDLLARRLHPKISDPQIKFLNWVEELGLPRGVELKPSPLSLTIQFEEIEELKERLKGISESLRKPGWKRL